MKSMLILGSQGMLGSSVTELFYRSNSFKVNEINRTSIVNGKYFDASSTSVLKLIEDIRLVADDGDDESVFFFQRSLALIP